MKRYQEVRSRESSARTYAASFDRVFESAVGVRLRDHVGKVYIDCLSCAGALPLGHNHPEIRQALLQFIMSDHAGQALDLTTPEKHSFVSELFDTLPKAFSRQAKIQFCSPSGSDAVEAAIKLCRHATGRHNIIAFHGAYHGMTSGALAAMGNLGPKSISAPMVAGTHFAPYPYSFRCPFGTDGRRTDDLSLGYLRTMLTDPESGIQKPAAVIVEVVQGEGGCIPASDQWLRAVRQLTREHGVALIVDEVQTGFCRTGRMFAFQRSGIEPDVLVLSKALGGGQPLAVVVYNESFDGWPRGVHAGTFRGNQIAMVAGRVTMEILRRERLDEHAAEMGKMLRSGLIELAQRYPFIGDVRGHGLMLGIEIVKSGSSDRPGAQDGALAKAIKQCAFENGLMVETGGRHGAVLRLLPPLIVQPVDIGEILERLDTAMMMVNPRCIAHAA